MDSIEKMAKKLAQEYDLEVKRYTSKKEGQIIFGICSQMMRKNIKGWKDISEAPKDGSVIIAKFKDIFPDIMPDRPDARALNGNHVPLKYLDSFSGWSTTYSGISGLPEEWIEGFLTVEEYQSND